MVAWNQDSGSIELGPMVAWNQDSGSIELGPMVAWNWDQWWHGIKTVVA